MQHKSRRIRAVRSSGLLDINDQPEFNDIVEAVKCAFRCPVSVLSILDEDRQVFIAHLGLPGQWAESGETPLTHSFCQHVVRDRQPLIIGDATIHDLVRDNLAIPDLGVVSYMGVPVTLPDGMVIGALAAIDSQPRDWTEAELELLSRLGKVACNQIATFLSERRWSSLFDQLEEGIIVGTVVRELGGAISDWRYDSVNPAWSALLDVDDVDVVGKTSRDLLPGIEDAWISDVAEVVESGDSKRFTRKVETIGRWFDGYIQATGDDTFVIIFIDVTERMQAVAALSESENRLRLIVQGAKDYVIITIDEHERITSWFGGAEEAFGRSEADMIGRQFADIFSQEERSAGIPQMEIAEARRDGVALDRRWHTRMDGAQVFLDGTVRPLPKDKSGKLAGFIKVARNATAEKLSEVRQFAFLELGDKIRELNQVEDVAFAAAEIMARHLPGSTRAGYGVVDPVAETVQMLPDWRAKDVLTLAGLHHFRDYGSFIEDLKRGEAVIIADVSKDDRTAGSSATLFSIGIAALLNVPIIEHGALVGVMFVHCDQPHSFTQEEKDFVRTIADRTREAVSRVRAEQEQQVLNHEISHRLKNTLAMVQAIATQTLRPITDRGPVEAFTSRLHALSKAHEVLLSQEWSAARMVSLIDSVLSQISLPERLTVDGPDLELGPRTALSIALLLHELGTNALKYGAWSNTDGTVSLTWEVTRQNDEDALTMRWVESGGPAVTSPQGKGFGSKLIRLGLMGTGGVDIDYATEGLRVELRGLVSQLRQS